jgi:hypothetical protein
LSALVPLITAPPGSCLVFNNNTANGVDCGSILGGIISRATAPIQWWAYGATIAIIILGIALPVTIWRMGPLGRRLWGWKGDIAVFLFPNGTGEIYKVTQAFSSWMKIISKRVSGLLRSGTDTSYPTSFGQTIHVVEASSRTSANMNVVEYTEALDEKSVGWQDENNKPEVIPRSIDEAAIQYFKYRIRGGQDPAKNIEKLKAGYQLRYGEEIPAEIVTILSSEGDPVQQLAKTGGQYLRRFKELMVEMAAADPEPLWPIAGVGVDARVIFRWASSQDHPVDYDVAYQSGYEDGKADSKTDDKRFFYVIIIIAIFVGGAIFASVVK